MILKCPFRAIIYNSEKGYHSEAWEMSKFNGDFTRQVIYQLYATDPS
jgi:hypothetical protein